MVRLVKSSEKVNRVSSEAIVCDPSSLTCRQSLLTTPTAGRELVTLKDRVTVVSGRATTGDTVIASTSGVAAEKEKRDKDFFAGEVHKSVQEYIHRYCSEYHLMIT